MTHFLVTGVAGFIGFHLAGKLCAAGHAVTGIDCVNDYYDVGLKNDRLKELEAVDNFTFHKIDLADRAAMEKIFTDVKPEKVVHLAAQAGVRYSIDNPHAYIDSNIVGFMNILEGCRHHDVKHLVYASSSSVYGANEKMPFSVEDRVDHPVSLYAATKKSNELMAYTYAHLYGVPTTGLRFFTVYGPWGRPDMAYYGFTQKIFNGQPIDVYNHGKMQRDFTYIDDIIEGVVRVADFIPSVKNDAPYAIYNIGNNKSVPLMEMIETLEKEIGIAAKKNFLPMQPGDVPATYANVDDLQRDVGFKPETSLRDGLREFVSWYRGYHGNRV